VLTVKFPTPTYLIKANHNMHYLDYLFEEFQSMDGVECVSQDQQADIGINNPHGVSVSLLLDYDDFHGGFPAHLADKLLDQATADHAVYRGIPLSRLVPSQNWSRDDTHYIQKADKFDVWSPTYSNPVIEEFASLLKRAKLHVIPTCIPESIFYPGTKETDLFFSGAICGFYPYRLTFVEIARSVKAKSVIDAYGDRERFKACDTRELFEQQLMRYSEKMRKAKLTFTDGGAYNAPVRKYFESIGSGTLLLASLPCYGKELGFIDGQTFVEVTPHDFEHKLKYYLHNDKERERITANAYRLFKERFTCSAVAEYIIKNFS